jgi:hypothetical protein
MKKMWDQNGRFPVRWIILLIALATIIAIQIADFALDPSPDDEPKSVRVEADGTCPQGYVRLLDTEWCTPLE